MSNRRKAITIVRYWKSGQAITKRKLAGTVEYADLADFAIRHGYQIVSVSHRKVTA